MLQTVTSAANLLPDLARSQTIGNPAIVSLEQNGRSLVRPLLLASWPALPALGHDSLVAWCLLILGGGFWPGRL